MKLKWNAETREVVALKTVVERNAVIEVPDKLGQQLVRQKLGEELKDRPAARPIPAIPVVD